MLKAKTRIKYQGQRYFPGQELPESMDEKTANSLVFAGSAVRVVDGAEVPSKPKKEVKTEKAVETETQEEVTEETAPVPEKPNFAKWNKPRLLKYAKRIKGVTLTEDMLQPEMVKLLNAALDARPSDEKAAKTETQTTENTEDEDSEVENETDQSDDASKEE